jgi:competence ComEA-like helix-hairpin-helix protein
VLPLISRHIRSELTKRAEKESIAIFASNLKQLLLQSTTKGEPILGIDPGFTNGCKLALISECSEVLEVGVVYPHTKNKDRPTADGEKLAQMMRKHKCSLIALGNATACRETEAWLTELFRMSILDANTVRYCIVSEQGASTYSCSKTAKQEFPDLDVNSISAVSIARRLSDPLCELVKVEPHHLGVGMYQHDINEKQLIESLNEVVMECVSYVGVDINTASVCLLSHVAGLTAKRAENVVKHRQQHGPFKSREDLKKVKFIGDKTFVQCAGFVRIEPLTAGVKDDYNFLDSTWVHPESYELANMIMRRCDLTNSSVGSGRFIEKIKRFAAVSASEALEKEFKQPFERVCPLL